jgi:hypothetical protein
LTINIRSLKPIIIHVLCNELVAKVLEYDDETQRSILFTNTSTCYLVSGKGLPTYLNLGEVFMGRDYLRVG